MPITFRNHRIHPRLVAYMCFLLPCVASNSHVGRIMADVYLGTIGFFTGLLAVATSSQLFLTHLIARFDDTYRSEKTMSKVSRVAAYVFQVLLTLFVTILVFAAPYTDASRVIMGDPGSERRWSLLGRLAAALGWTLANMIVLIDTFIYAVVSLYLMFFDCEKGCALLVLMAAAGAYDLVSLSTVFSVLRTARLLDRISIQQPSVTRRPGILFPVADHGCSTVSRLKREFIALQRTPVVTSAINTSLAVVGAQPFELLEVAVLRSKYKMFVKAPRVGRGQYVTEDGAHVISQLTRSQWCDLGTFLNVNREPYWRLTEEKAQVDKEKFICDFRVFALDLLHAYHRMARWKYNEVVVRNHTLHWVRCRMITEWCVGLPFHDGFVLSLNDGSEYNKMDSRWWFNSQTLWHSLSGISISAIPARSSSSSEFQALSEEIREWHEKKLPFDEGRIGARSGYIEKSWEEDSRLGLQLKEHGSDWSQVLITRRSLTTWKIRTRGKKCENLKELFEFPESEHDVGGMNESGWFALLLTDLVLCYKFLFSEGALRGNERALVLLGGYAFGMIRVATRRSGIREIFLDGPHHLPSEQLTLACFFYSLGMELVFNTEIFDGGRSWWVSRRPFSKNMDGFFHEAEHIARYVDDSPFSFGNLFSSTSTEIQAEHLDP